MDLFSRLQLRASGSTVQLGRPVLGSLLNAAAFAASWSVERSEWLYRSAVIAVRLGARRFETTSMSVPAASYSEACSRRVPLRVIFAGQAFARSFSNNRVTYWGLKGRRPP